jgi:hypothetical protein
MHHIYTGLSTALGNDSQATRSCNAVLHNMTTVEVEHIAYSCVQVISSLLENVLFTLSFAGAFWH